MDKPLFIQKMRSPFVSYTLSVKYAINAAVYSAYISSNADNIYDSYMTANADALYREAAYQALLSELQGNGMDKKTAQNYLSGDEGQLLIAGSVTEMSDEQKSKIVDTAVKDLTTEQKSEIKDAYIRQLKGSLDSYSTFCEGVTDYTAAVSEASDGASSLESGLSALHKNTGKLKDSVSLLNDSAKKLSDGSAELKPGTAEFAKETDKFSEDAVNEISEMLGSLTGEENTVSFASNKNTNVKSLQFVIKTAAIEKAEAESNTVESDSTKSLWDKFLDLFR